MLKKIYIIIILILLVPIVVFAAWNGEFSWNNRHPWNNRGAWNNSESWSALFSPEILFSNGESILTTSSGSRITVKFSGGQSYLVHKQ